MVFRAVGPEWILFDPRSQNLHALNLSAATVWLACDGGSTAVEIARHLQELMEDAPPEDALLTDVLQALARFQAEGLLE